jgi:hypothetical protein
MVSLSLFLVCIYLSILGVSKLGEMFLFRTPILIDCNFATTSIRRRIERRICNVPAIADGRGVIAETWHRPVVILHLSEDK